MRKLTILGATGSIGSSTLAVVAHHPQKYQVVALTAHANVDAMLSLCLQWQPRYAAMADINAANLLKRELKRHGCATEVLGGSEGVCAVAALEDVDSVMAAIVGAAGFAPTMAAVKAGKRVLLANKEALVMSGQFLIDAAVRYGATLLPVDSEHNALFQCLPTPIQQQMGHCDLEAAGISKLLLTGSGGPFRYTELEALQYVTPAQAIMHPNWSMGPKISVDSATMMNKGLEYIEAKWLFNARQSQLEVIIHPQSVIHSMVQYQDGSVLAQLGQPDMKTPIAVALDYPNRIETGVAPLDFCALGELSFIKPDYQRYPCLKLAIEACYAGQAATTTLNAANEEAVVAFLAGQIGFMQIATINDLVLQRASLAEPNSFDDLLELDSAARHVAQTYIARLNK